MVQFLASSLGVVMKTLLIACCVVGLELLSNAQSPVGSLIYQTARFAGKAVPIYGVDPTDPTYQVHGDNLALYARRQPVLGADYWAELWVGPESATEAGLSPVSGTRVHFREDISAIRGIDSLGIRGTLGGDIVTVQLRVWAATSGGRPISKWNDVLADPSAPRGTSNLSRIVLGNISADGHPFIPQLLSYSLQGFGLYVVPEPTGYAALGLGLTGLHLLHRHRPKRGVQRSGPPSSSL